jgi:hypothetical protein
MSLLQNILQIISMVCSFYRYWWWQLATRWDEFEQHEESMEVYNSRNINPPNVSVQPGQNPPFLTNQQWMKPMAQMPSMMPQMTFESNPPSVPDFEMWKPADGSLQNQPMQVQIPRNDLRYRGPTNVERSPYTPVMPRGQELVRRPIHPSNKSISSKLKATFMSAIGMGPSSPHPPGLQNNGQNACFMNAVLQCLAHTPSLAASVNPNI